MIVLNDISFAYRSDPILQDINLAISQGQLVGVIGPNGGGKTTFLKLILGLLAPTKGQVQVFGRSPSEAALQVGYVPQAHRFDRAFPIAVYELVLMGALSACTSWGRYPKAVRQRADALLEEVGLIGYRNAPFSALSGGQAQRALFARALMTNPKMLLLDEPTSHLDPSSSKIILRKLKALKGQTTILFVTHDYQSVVEIADQVLCVQGQVTSYMPSDVCGHFALGLYHAPLTKGPAL
ncbi:MAG: hypothetical protein RL235_653 [Chlamydiota bacterium]|jgi:zinc transport system ATP-binding protein